MNIFFAAAFVFICIGFGALVLVGPLQTLSVVEDTSEPSETETYIGEVVDVDNNRITLSNGDVIFAQGVYLFKWKLGKTYAITIDTYHNKYGTIKKVKEINEV